MDMDGSSLAAAALYDMKNEQLQVANASLQQHDHSDKDQQQGGATSGATTHQASDTTANGQRVAEEGRHACFRSWHGLHLLSLFFVWIEMGPEIPFEMGQFLLYKGHFLNLLHFPIWKVHTKRLLLKYDTVLADSEIAWEATDEVRIIHSTHREQAAPFVHERRRRTDLKSQLRACHNCSSRC